VASLVQNARVYHRRADIHMPEEFLDCAEVVRCLKQVGREGMPPACRAGGAGREGVAGSLRRYAAATCTISGSFALRRHDGVAGPTWPEASALWVPICWRQSEALAPLDASQKNPPKQAVARRSPCRPPWMQA